MNKKILGVFFLLMLVFCVVDSVSATDNLGGIFSKQGAEYIDNGIIVNTLMYNIVKVDENFTVYMTPYEQSGKTLSEGNVDCRLGIVNPDGSRLYLLYQENFTIISDGDIWTAIIPAEFLNETGKYLYNWDCQDVLRGGYFNGILTVTKTGIEHPLDNGRTILLSFFLILLFAFIYMNRNTNYEQWFSSMVKKYETRNYFKMVMSILGYNIVKNAFVVYYLIGFIILIIATDIVVVYNIENILGVMKGLMIVYAWSSIAVAISFLSYFQEFFMDFMEELTNLDWGVNN